MISLEKAVLRTLVYSDLFDYPLKGWEIHKWLVERKASLSEVEGVLLKLVKQGRVEWANDYYFLPGRKGLVKQRLKKEVVAKSYLARARWVALMLKLIPWLKLVGISGGLAMNNVTGEDDIDLFVVTEPRRLWISRLMILLLLAAAGLRRKRSDSRATAAGKFCVNILVDLTCLGQKSQNLYIAHEVLQMRLLWQRDFIYSKYLEDNAWTANFLPNWTAQERFGGLKGREKKFKVKYTDKKRPVDIGEFLAKTVQLKIMSRYRASNHVMSQPKGSERVEAGALYFHPLNYQEQILKKYRERFRLV